MLKAVVFDMDETLLSINLNAFILRYFKDVSSMLADIGRRSRGGTMARLGTILVDLNANRRSGTDNRTNLEFTAPRSNAGAASASPILSSTRHLPTTTAKFFRIRMTTSSTPTPCRAHTPRFRPYRTQGCAARSSPTPAFRRGPSSAAWVGATWPTPPFELVTHMGNTTRCKPDATYYLEQLKVMGLEPHEVLMVGNDPKRDFPSPACGIQTAYVGQGKPGRATWRGTMEDFAREFNAVVEAFYEHQVADELS